MGKSSEYVELSGRRIRETDAAVLWFDFATEEQHWFPLSQVEEFHVDKDGVGTILVSAWIAKQKGLWS